MVHFRYPEPSRYHRIVKESLVKQEKLLTSEASSHAGSCLRQGATAKQPGRSADQEHDQNDPEGALETPPSIFKFKVTAIGTSWLIFENGFLYRHSRHSTNPLDTRMESEDSKMCSPSKPA
jgi:hypothetical protein